MATVQCQLDPSIETHGDSDSESVPRNCKRLAALISADDREAWLRMVAPHVAFRGGKHGLREKLRAVSLADLLDLPPRRSTELIVVRDCSHCRRFFVEYGFTSSPWVVVVEYDQITWLGRTRVDVENGDR